MNVTSSMSDCDGLTGDFFNPYAEVKRENIFQHEEKVSANPSSRQLHKICPL